MRKLSILGGLILFAAVPAMAQDNPKGEVAGNYTYVNIDTNGSSLGRLNCHGGGGSAAWNANSYLGVVGEFSGCKVTGLPSGASAHTLTYLFGPRLTYRGSGGFEPFGEFLFGGAHSSISGGGATATDNAFAMAIGGGADYKMTSSVAIRLAQFDYLYTKFGNTHQNNFRVQAGIVFRFGGR
jgi:opacity protein-like surface antigen